MEVPDAQVASETRRWLERAVIGLNLCPFAKAVHVKQQVHYAVSPAVGWMQQWSSLGQFVGPPVVAWVATRTGGWSFSWVVMASCGVIGLVLARALGRLHTQRLAGAP